MHYIPTFPMWWLRRSGVVVCAKSFRPDFQTQACEPRLFFATATSSHPLRKMQNSTFTYGSLSTISRLHSSATYRRQPSKLPKKNIVDESRRYPRQVSFFFFWWESYSAEREACTSGAGVPKLHASSTSRLTWARPRPSSLSGRTLPWKLGESCVPDKAPSRTAFYRLRGCTFYYLVVFNMRTDMHKPQPLRDVELVQAVGI